MNPFVFLKLMLFCVSCLFVFGLRAQIEISFNDTIIKNTELGSYMIEPYYRSLGADTLKYSIRLNSLFNPYPDFRFCSGDKSFFLLEFIIAESSKGTKLIQYIQGNRKTYELNESEISLEIPFSCDGIEVLLGNYIFQKYPFDDKIYLTNQEMLNGIFKIEGKQYKIFISPYVGNFNLEFALSLTSNDTYRIGDIFGLDNKFYKLTEFDYFERRGVVKEVKNTELFYFGYDEGKYLKNFEEIMTTIQGNEYYNKPMDAEKAYLIHFWGEWCLPCVKRIDSDKNLFAKINGKKVNIVNVAGIIKPEHVSRSVALIKEKEMPYFHLLDNGQYLINPLRISTYPTYLLISSDGEILYKESLDSYAEVQKFMKILKDNDFLN